MVEVTKSELEEIVLRALFEFVQTSSGFLTAESIVSLLGGGFTESRVSMALRVLGGAGFVQARHNAIKGSSYEISDSGYEAVEEDRQLRRDDPSENVADVLPTAISSSSWTGRTNLDLDEIRKARLLQLLAKAESDIPAMALSNEDSAQGLAYIQAIKVLTEAPDPPDDLIWELINRANSIAGIAALFVSIIGLFH